DLAVNLGKALHRLCPFYDNKWELLNGYALRNPPDPIVFDRDGLHVLVVENGIAHSRKITEIRDLGTEVEVSDGVKQGDQIVLTPPVDLEDGSKVQVRATPMAKSS